MNRAETVGNERYNRSEQETDQETECLACQ